MNFFFDIRDQHKKLYMHEKVKKLYIFFDFRDQHKKLLTKYLRIQIIYYKSELSIGFSIIIDPLFLILISQSCPVLKLKIIHANTSIRLE